MSTTMESLTEKLIRAGKGYVSAYTVQLQLCPQGGVLCRWRWVLWNGDRFIADGYAVTKDAAFRKAKRARVTKEQGEEWIPLA